MHTQTIDKLVMSIPPGSFFQTRFLSGLELLVQSYGSEMAWAISLVILPGEYNGQLKGLITIENPREGVYIVWFQEGSPGCGLNNNGPKGNVLKPGQYTWLLTMCPIS